jgi:hypothetical protein
VVRFTFSLDEDAVSPSGLVTTETRAYYLVDGTLRLDGPAGVVFEEAGVPLVEFAVWLSRWWQSPHLARSFAPEGFDTDEGPMLLLAPAGGTGHRLTYCWADPVVHWTAALDAWGHAVMQYREDLRQALWEQYRLRLDALLPPL